jgi:hypothetical protein
MMFIPLKTKSGNTFRTNIVDGDNRSRPQGHVVEQLDEAKRHKWQSLRDTTHIRCIDVVWAPVQRISERRWNRTGNPAARWRPVGGVSSNSRAQLQTREPSQRGEDWREGWMSQGGLWHQNIFDIIWNLSGVSRNPFDITRNISD